MQQGDTYETDNTSITWSHEEIYEWDEGDERRNTEMETQKYNVRDHTDDCNNPDNEEDLNVCIGFKSIQIVVNAGRQDHSNKFLNSMKGLKTYSDHLSAYHLHTSGALKSMRMHTVVSRQTKLCGLVSVHQRFEPIRVYTSIFTPKGN